jgi:hypothetical protein
LWSPGFRFAHSLFNQYVVSRVLQSYLVNCNVPQYSPFWGFLSLLLIFFVSLKVHLVPALRPSFSSPSVHSRTLFKSGLHSRFCVRFSVRDGAAAQLLLLRDHLRKTKEAVGQWRNRGRRNSSLPPSSTTSMKNSVHGGKIHCPAGHCETPMTMPADSKNLLSPFFVHFITCCFRSFSCFQLRDCPSMRWVHSIQSYEVRQVVSSTVKLLK